MKWIQFGHEGNAVTRTHFDLFYAVEQFVQSPNYTVHFGNLLSSNRLLVKYEPPKQKAEWIDLTRHLIGKCDMASNCECLQQRTAQVFKTFCQNNKKFLPTAEKQKQQVFNWSMLWTNVS